MNNKLINATAIIAKVIEIIFWVGSALMFVGCIVILAGGETVRNLITAGIEDGSLSVIGFNINVFSADGSVNIFALIVAFIAAIICMVIGALICRNINQIFKAEKPFCNDNTQRVRRIGFYAIVIPIVEVILCIIVCIVQGVAAKVSVNLTTVFFGLVILCISQFFNHGASLEKDVDGLL